MPLTTLVPSELFGTKCLGAIIGALVLLSTLGGAVGPPVAGYVFDRTGSYHAVLPALAAISVITALLGAVLLKHRGN